jgi:phage I-like protein
MMANLDEGHYDLALMAETGAPEWVHLFPLGKMTGRDGRAFELADAPALVLAFQSAAVDLPIDFEHQYDRPEAKLNGPVPAAGWIKELKVLANGLWGRVAWTATASEMIAKREYRYLSPSFLFHRETRHIVQLKGAGLVHNPNLHLAAANFLIGASQESAMQPTGTADKTATDASPDAGLASALATLLGLPPDTKPADRLAKLTAALKAAPDPAKFVPAEAVQSMLHDHNLARATAAEERATAKVTKALDDGYFHRGLRDWAMALCRSDEPAFDKFLASQGPIYGYLFKETHTRNTPPARHAGAQADTEMAAAICAQLGLKPDALNS